MKLANAPTETKATSPAIQQILRARARRSSADCHADHRHRGDTYRE